ncbi:hypothetical protein ACKVE0_07955 [Acinetobacter albensis]|uniref:Uncharacterized protein n=1 Tax=Acinetobacter albensis TaxID=1673609 RepID=A0ABW9JSS8_9GAMM
MKDTYRYLYTRISIFGFLPTHKVFVSNTSKKSKLIFADNTFIYGLISDWALNNSDFGSDKVTWLEEPKSYLDNEIKKLGLYRSSHPEFITESEIH